MVFLHGIEEELGRLGALSVAKNATDADRKRFRTLEKQYQQFLGKVANDFEASKKRAEEARKQPKPLGGPVASLGLLADTGPTSLLKPKKPETAPPLDTTGMSKAELQKRLEEEIKAIGELKVKLDAGTITQEERSKLFIDQQDAYELAVKLWSRGIPPPDDFLKVMPANHTYTRKGASTDPLEELTRRAAERRTRIRESVLAWATKKHLSTTEKDPLIAELIMIGIALGWEVLGSILEAVTAKTDLGMFAEVVNALANREGAPETGTTLLRGLLAKLDAALNAPPSATPMDAATRSELELSRQSTAKHLATLALVGRTIPQLAAGLSALYAVGIYAGAEVEALKKAIHELLSRSDPGDKDDLTAIASGRLSTTDLERLADAALKEGRIEVFAAAAIEVIKRQPGPIAATAARAISLLTGLRDLSGLSNFDVHVVAALKTATKAFEPIRTKLDEEHALLMKKIEVSGKEQEKYRRLLEKIRQRQSDDITADEWKILDAIDPDAHVLANAGYITWVGRLEDAVANHWASVTAHTSQIGDEIRALYKLTLMLRSANMFTTDRDTVFAVAIGDAQRAIKAEIENELTRETVDHVNDGYGLLEGLQAMADAADELYFSQNKDNSRNLNGGADINTALQEISDELNTHIDTSLGPTLYNHWITGLIEKLSRLPKDSTEARLLRKRIAYLRHRRLNLYLLDPVRYGRARLEADAKHDEEIWKSLRPFSAAGLSDELGWMFGDTAENRALREVQDYNLWELPGQVWQLTLSLDDPKGFMAFLATAQRDKVARGNAAWEAYVDTPWYRRGLFHQTSQIINAPEIIDKMIKTDRMFWVALRAGSTTAVDKLPADLWQILKDNGFIEGADQASSKYVIPLQFRWNATSVGEQESVRDWSDDVFNVLHLAEIAGTWYLGGLAGESLQWLRAEREAGILTELLFGTVRVGAEATIFTGLSSVMRGDVFNILSGDWSAKDVFKEWLGNVVAIGGLNLLGPLFETLEEEFLTMFPGKSAADSWRTAVTTLTKEDWMKLLHGTITGTFKAGAEAGFLTFGNATVEQALDGTASVSMEAFLRNIAVVAQMKSIGLLSKGQADALMKEARKVAGDYLAAEKKLTERAKKILERMSGKRRHELTKAELQELAGLRSAMHFPMGIDAWLEIRAAQKVLAELAGVDPNLWLHTIGIPPEALAQIKEELASRQKKLGLGNKELQGHFAIGSRTNLSVSDVKGTVLEAASEALLRSKGEDAVNVNTVTEDPFFPLFDIITDSRFVSCKAYSNSKVYVRFLRKLLKTTDYETARQQRQAAQRLLELKNKLGKKLPWPTKLKEPFTERKIISFINQHGEIWVPDDQVDETRAAIRAEAMKFPENWGLEGMRKTSPEFKEALRNLEQRIQGGGTTLSQIDGVLRELNVLDVLRH